MIWPCVELNIAFAASSPSATRCVVSGAKTATVMMSSCAWKHSYELLFSLSFSCKSRSSTYCHCALHSGISCKPDTCHVHTCHIAYIHAETSSDFSLCHDSCHEFSKDGEFSMDGHFTERHIHAELGWEDTHVSLRKLNALHLGCLSASCIPFCPTPEM